MRRKRKHRFGADGIGAQQEDALAAIERIQTCGAGVECGEIMAAMTAPTSSVANLHTMLQRLQFRLAATHGENRRLKCDPVKPRRWRVERRGA